MIKMENLVTPYLYSPHLVFWTSLAAWACRFYVNVTFHPPPPSFWSPLAISQNCTTSGYKSFLLLKSPERVLYNKIFCTSVYSTYLKEQSNEIFDLQFFSSFEPAWATDQWVKIFLSLVKFSPSYSNFYESPQGGVWYCAESIGESNDFSRSYLKGQSNKIFYLFFS